MKLNQIYYTLIFVLVLITVSNNSFSQVNKNLLFGKWLFVTFELPPSSTESREFIYESNRKYRDVTYIITKDNKFFIQKKNGGKDWNKQTTYKLVQDRYIQLAVGQKMRIDFLDAKTLKIFVEGFQPIGIFKRIS